MRRTLVAFTLLAVVGTLAAGCGGGGASSGGSGPTSTAGGQGGGNAVTIDNLAFSPATLNLKTGQQVTWTNQQDIAHTVTADGGAFDHQMPPGGDVLLHLRQGGELPLPLHHPPVDDRDDPGVVGEGAWAPARFGCWGDGWGGRLGVLQGQGLPPAAAQDHHPDHRVDQQHNHIDGGEWTSPRGADTGVMRPLSMAVGERERSGVPIRRVAGSRWWSAAASGCSGESRRRSRRAPRRGCGNGGG
jgi:plastocyanin